MYLLIDLLVINIWDADAPKSILGDNFFFLGGLYQRMYRELCNARARIAAKTY